ncbi:hypothetical protein ZIOFF_019055 [Zingiber officinale]|uniref:Pentatricopeptide repeat-containing protein n=1 Tax=Zingiber officinale TaxID=94328 RepID=A0A8J5HDQ3_ZINOF|nr:hypothetical protein ZIOFF_019055 [Zingiber officinale]
MCVLGRQSVYSKKRKVNEAFDACRYLGDHGRIYPNQTTTEVMIDVMLKEGLLPKLVSVLDRIHGSRCAPSIIVNTTLAFRIIEEDRAEETITLLKRMLQRNMMFDDIAYSLIVTSYCKKKESKSIVETNRTLTSLLIMGLVPDQEIYLILIDGYGTTGDYQKIITLYYEMVHMGLEPNVRFYKSLVQNLCKCGQMSEAEKFIGILGRKGLTPTNCMYNSLIIAYRNRGGIQRALIFYEMIQMELVPCSDAFMLLAKKMLEVEHLTAGFGSMQLTEPLTKHFEHGLRSYCFIVHVLVRSGLLIDARALLESAVSKYTERVASQHASIVEVLLSIYEAVFPGHRVFDLLLQVYSKKRMVNEAFDACRYLGDHGRIYPNQTTTEVMIDVMLKEGVLSKLVSVLDRIRGSRCAPGIIVNTTLAFRIIEEDRAEEAITLLKRMLQRNMMFDDIAYSLIVASYCKLCKLD